MTKRNKIIFFSILILSMVAIMLCIKNVVKRGHIEYSDAYTFREEYMSYNDKITSDNEAYLEVNIREDNMINYITEKEAIDMLSNGSGIIYFGYPQNKECRKLISPLLEASEELNETIFYMDIEKTLEDNTSPLIEKIYEKLNLEEVKVLKAPILISLKDGEVMSFLTSDILDGENLEEVIKNLILSKNGDLTCPLKGC